MNVVIYARYSSHSQNEQSIEGQLAACQQYAIRNEYNVIGEYIDRAMSGTNDNRPEFKRMIEESGKKLFGGIIVYQLDRFARNRYDSAINKARLKKNGVRVLSVRENISDDASGIIMEGLLESMAEYYSAELSQKVKRGLDINASKCLRTGGYIPLGYKVDENKRFVIDEEAASVVIRIYDLYANGKTITQINDILNSQQLRTALGNEFTKSSLRTILRNQRYIGYYLYKDEKIEGGVPRIVSDELFYRVAQIMDKNHHAPARSRAKEEYILTTKLFCGHCKDMMTGTSGTSRHKKIYNYYICNNAKKKLCDKKTVSKSYIEDLVIAECRKMLTPERIKQIARDVVASCESNSSHSELLRLSKLLKANEKQRVNLFNTLKICDVESIKKSLFEEIGKIDNAHQDLENQIAREQLDKLQITVPQVMFFLNDLKDGNPDDLLYRKLLINSFINSIYLYDDKLTLIFNAGKSALSVNRDLTPEIEASDSCNKGSPLDCSSPPYGKKRKEAHFHIRCASFLLQDGGDSPHTKMNYCKQSLPTRNVLNRGPNTLFFNFNSYNSLLIQII